VCSFSALDFDGLRRVPPDADDRLRGAAIERLSHSRVVVLLVFLVALGAVGARAQEPAPAGAGETVVPAAVDGQEQSDGGELPAESTEGEAEAAEDMTGAAEEAAVEPWSPDPVGALWRSGVLAGLGQFYNERWLKGAVMMGCELFTLGGLVYYAGLAADELAEGREIDLPDDFSSPELSELRAEREAHYAQYEDYRVRYETYLWLSVFVVVYSMIDAYVDAHLWDFEVGEDLVGSLGTGGQARENGVSLELEPVLYPEVDGGWRTGLELSLTF
jgi:hypothetical protein